MIGFLVSRSKQCQIVIRCNSRYNRRLTEAKRVQIFFLPKAQSNYPHKIYIIDIVLGPLDFLASLVGEVNDKLRHYHCGEHILLAHCSQDLLSLFSYIIIPLRFLGSLPTCASRACMTR